MAHTNAIPTTDLSTGLDLLAALLLAFIAPAVIGPSVALTLTALGALVLAAGLTAFALGGLGSVALLACFDRLH